MKHPYRTPVTPHPLPEPKLPRFRDFFLNCPSCGSYKPSPDSRTGARLTIACTFDSRDENCRREDNHLHYHCSKCGTKWLTRTHENTFKWTSVVLIGIGIIGIIGSVVGTVLLF